MNSLSILARTVAFTAAINLTPAAAQTLAAGGNTVSNLPRTAYAAPAQNTTGAPHWEWQYHYVGHHARYEGHWVLVR